MDQPNNQKRIVTIAVLFVGILFILFIMVLLGHHGKAKIQVTVIPSDSILTVDGKKTKAGTVYLTKTTHTLKASRPPFSPTTKTINFATYDTSQTLYVNPVPNSDKALQYLLKHPEIQAQREAASGVQAGEAQQQLRKNKLVGLLPYRGPGTEYLIDYGTKTQQDGTQKVTIYIESDTDQAKQEALNWITSQNIDLKTLTIVYESLPAGTNPNSSGGSEYQ
ncbi:MAG TPA: hypothetical protein VLG92_00850 [Candidatus Saccharimonadia bacterium]|nr:hypothetical protein [Candidatus Saccharimonadia bacterium]